jgi:hypothetical protein
MGGGSTIEDLEQTVRFPIVALLACSSLLTVPMLPVLGRAGETEKICYSTKDFFGSLAIL